MTTDTLIAPPAIPDDVAPLLRRLTAAAAARHGGYPHFVLNNGIDGWRLLVFVSASEAPGVQVLDLTPGRSSGSPCGVVTTGGPDLEEVLVTMLVVLDGVPVVKAADL